MTNHCVHDHNDGTVKRELRHLKDHWVSCLISCLAIHLVLDAVSWIWSKF